MYTIADVSVYTVFARLAGHQITLSHYKNYPS